MLSADPPSEPDRAPTPPKSIDAQMKRLNHPQQDIQVLPSREKIFRDTDPQPKLFGDFNPNPNIWPLEKYDQGDPASTRNLIQISTSYPAPHPPRCPKKTPPSSTITTQSNSHLTSNSCHRGTSQTHFTRRTVNAVATNESTRAITLTRDRRKALTLTPPARSTPHEQSIVKPTTSRTEKPVRRVRAP